MPDQPQARVLVVDDEVELMRALTDALSAQQFAPTGVTDPAEAIAALHSKQFDLLLTDLMMPEIDGMRVLRAGLEADPDLVGIVMTGHGTIPSAVEAIKSGAYDYILKPFKLQSILPMLNRGVEVRQLKKENQRLRQYVERLTFESSRYTIVGHSHGMQLVARLIEKVAPTDATVLIRGPSGAGKEMVARALHHNSLRKSQPLVTINCAAMQEALLESELFGHEKGAFTGAVTAKRGLFEVAEGGTLFIDEVAEMSPSMQAKLLRVLEDGHYRKVGGTSEHYANVRVIAATNKPLEKEQIEGRFREDLFYRLNVFAITLPALKDRPDDIPELVEHFLQTRAIAGKRCRFSPEAMNALTAYHWPGNVRELANVIERALILTDTEEMSSSVLPDNITSCPSHRATAEPVHRSPPQPNWEERAELSQPSVANHTIDPGLIASNPHGLNDSQESLNLRDQEERTVRRALTAAKGNKVKAARMLGVSRRALYRLIDKYKMESADDNDQPTE